MKLNSGVKQKFLRTLAGAVICAGLLPVSSAFAVSAFPTSGSCAMLVTQPVPLGMTTPNDVGYNILAVITLTSSTAGTITFNNARVNYTTGGITMAASSSEADVPITIAPLVAPAPTAGRSITFTTTGDPQGGVSTVVVANAIAVNGGNTILIQGDSDAFSGVCQF